MILKKINKNDKINSKKGEERRSLGCFLKSITVMVIVSILKQIKLHRLNYIEVGIVLFTILYLSII